MGGAWGGPKKLGKPGIELTGGFNPGKRGTGELMGLKEPGNRGVGMVGKPGTCEIEGGRLVTNGKFGMVGKYGFGRLVDFSKPENNKTMRTNERLISFNISIFLLSFLQVIKEKKVSV